jgi:hypothetical protein
MIINASWKGCGRKRSLPVLSYYHAIWLEGLREINSVVRSIKTHKYGWCHGVMASFLSRFSLRYGIKVTESMRRRSSALPVDDDSCKLLHVVSYDNFTRSHFPTQISFRGLFTCLKVMSPSTFDVSQRNQPTEHHRQNNLLPLSVFLCASTSHLIS